MIIIRPDVKPLVLTGTLNTADGRIQLSVGTLGMESVPVKLLTMEQSVRGPAGSGRISDDPDNMLKRGSDGGLFVLDDLQPDPLIAYILAKG